MKIVIMAMDDPLYTNSFIKEIIECRRADIVEFVYVSKGNRLTLGKQKSKLEYLISLLLIMRPWHFCKNAFITIIHKFKIKLSKRISFIKSPLVIDYAKSLAIPVREISNPNSKKFLKHLASLEPDIVINQSQAIIKKKLLDIPKIGVLNRHNALLPKNRGRLTPFWVLYKQEQETGVSIHFVEEGLDSGDIIVKKKFTVSPQDNFNSLVKKNYQIAGKAMLEAIDKLENGFSDFLENNDAEATYNTTPTLQEAWGYFVRSFAKKRRMR